MTTLASALFGPQDTRLLFPEFLSLTNLDLSNNLLGLTYLQACTRKQWTSNAQCGVTDATILEVTAPEPPNPP